VLDATERSNPGISDPVVTIIAADFRARCFLLEFLLLDGGGVPNGRQMVVRTIIDGSTTVDKLVSDAT
jgi:hypothetical protein